MPTQVNRFGLEKPRVTIVRQKHRMLRGRFLFTLLLVPLLLVMIPALLHISLGPQGFKISIGGAEAAPPQPQHVISTNAVDTNPKPAINLTPTPTHAAKPKKTSHTQAPTQTISNYNTGTQGKANGPGKGHKKGPRG